MTINLTCTQVGALLSFYLDDRLNDQLKQFVSAHLDVCPICRSKFDALKNMVSSLKDVHEKISTMSPEEKSPVTSPQYNEFKTNLSAYIDNELTDDQNIKIKKYVISNPKARKELESMYNLKKNLRISFEKSRNESKNDYSKLILKRIDIQDEIYGSDSFAKVVAIFIAIFALFTLSALIVFWV
jgi:anti-sigma factor RsiW